MRNRTRLIVASLLAANAAILLSPVLSETTDSASSSDRPDASAPAKRAVAASTTKSTERRDLPALPAIESPEQIAAMPRAQIESIIAEIDGELDRSGAVERLNQDTVTAAERQRFGVLLERGSLMRNQLARLELQALERAVAEYELTHAERVAQYVRDNN